MKKISIIMVCLVLFTTLTGCGDTAKQDKGVQDAVKTNGVPISEYPISTDNDVTLKYWIAMPNVTSYITSYSENEAYQELEKKTGIKIEFLHPAVGQETEQFNLMVASGQYPDIITGANRYKGKIVKGIEDGIFQDLTEYIPTYAPDYYKLITSDPKISKDAIYEDGLIPAFFRVKPEIDPPWRRVMIRADWMEDAGLSEPVTLAEWENLFEAYKKVPGVLAPLIIEPNGVEELWIAMFGIWPGFYLKDGKEVAYGQIQPEFKQYLKLMNEWFQKGYFSKDFAGLKGSQLLNELTSGRSGVYPGSSDWLATQGKALNIPMIPTRYPRINMGDKLHTAPNDPLTGWDETVITTSSNYKEQAVRWLNYAYTDEGAMLFNYGIEGKSYVMENGKPKYTDHMVKNEKFPPDVATHVLRMHFVPKLTYSDLLCNPSVVANEDVIELRARYADDPDVDSSYRISSYRLDLEESTKHARIMAEVTPVIDEMVLKCIMGIESLDAFEQAVQRVKELGIDEAVELVKAAYERSPNQ